KDNHDAYYQRAYLNASRGPESYEINSRQVYDASYIRLKVVRLSYNLSELLTEPFLKKAQVYISATNLWTITDWPGLDPEIVTSDHLGLNTFDTIRTFDGYPLSRTITLGVNISL